MKSRIIAVVSGFIFLFVSSILLADTLKVGVVNMNVVLQQSGLMKSLNNGLIKQFQSRQDELAAAQKELQDEFNQLNINAVNMSNDDRARLQTKIATDQANVQTLSASLQRDVTIAKNDAMVKFTERLNQVIKNIANKGQYDLIEQSTNYLFIKPDLDITQAVLSQLK